MVINRDGRRWSFAASLGIETLVVALLILVPLIYSDRLAAIHRTGLAIGAPVWRNEPKPLPVHAARHPAVRRAEPRMLIWRRLEASRERRTERIESADIDAPPSGFLPFTGTWGEPTRGNVIDIAVPTPQPPSPKPVAAAPVKPQQQAPLKVGGDVQAAKLMRKVMPAYPAVARSARISGAVHLIGIISREGTIRNLQVLDGHPLLVRAALEAVAQWTYAPTLLNGEAVEVVAPIEVRFILSQ